MTDANYVDGYRSLHADKGYSFPVWDPHLRLDYVFVPKGFSERLLSCEVVTSPPIVKRASDHFPILSQLDFS
jgi:exodeoxyribonuclease-3